MILGYNTNGFAFHDPLEAIDVLGEIGYRSLAITVDHQWINPFSDDCHRQLQAIKHRLESWSMHNVIESGARFLLDPRKKHQPTLLSTDAEQRGRRIDFLRRCIEFAVELESQCVSLWSGMPLDSIDSQMALDRLANALEPVLRYAEKHQVFLGFEPEPGMFVASTADFERLRKWVDSDMLKLTMDIGHLYCLGEVPVADYIRRFERDIVNLHIEDMKAGVHSHLMFGEGEISFPPILTALKEIDYRGPIHVELSRQSHNACEIARDSFQFLDSIVRTHRPLSK